MSETWGDGEEDRRSFGTVGYRDCRYCDREAATHGSRLCALCAKDEEYARRAWQLRRIAAGTLALAEHDNPGPFCFHVAETAEAAAAEAAACHAARVEWACRERALVPLRIAAKRREEARRLVDRELHTALEARLLVKAVSKVVNND